MPTLKLKPNRATPARPAADRPPIRGSGTAPRPRPTLAQAQTERAERAERATRGPADRPAASATHDEAARRARGDERTPRDARDTPSRDDARRRPTTVDHRRPAPDRSPHDHTAGDDPRPNVSRQARPLTAERPAAANEAPPRRNEAHRNEARRPTERDRQTAPRDDHRRGVASRAPQRQGAGERSAPFEPSVQRRTPNRDDRPLRQAGSVDRGPHQQAGSADRVPPRPARSPDRGPFQQAGSPDREFPRRAASPDREPLRQAGSPERDPSRTMAPASRAETPASRRSTPSPSTLPSSDDGIRLSKRMSALGIASRREADEWIPKGWVQVDGRVVDQLGARVHPEQRITVDARARFVQAQKVTVLLHKPLGYVSGQAEDGHAPASVLVQRDRQWHDDASGTRFLATHLRGLAPAGRLDLDSTGLLVLTQDGRIARQLIGDDSAVEKEYRVQVTPSHGRPADAPIDLDSLRHGLELDGVPLAPAQVEQDADGTLRFVLREGRKRQIRRMCEAVGLQVVALQRVRIGGVLLGDLPPGQWRYLRGDEAFAPLSPASAKPPTSATPATPPEIEP